MTQEDDIFLNKFNEMITILKAINVNIETIKKSIEIIVPSIDGLGAGLTDINEQISDLLKKTTILSEDVIKKEKQPQDEILKKQSTGTASKILEAKPSKSEQKTKPDTLKYYHSTSPQHPIFIDLAQKINDCSTYQEAGEIFIESLEIIESKFSFSRVFYEIRRVGNSLIRKGEINLPPNEKLGLNESIIEWEQRLNE